MLSYQTFEWESAQSIAAAIEFVQDGAAAIEFGSGFAQVNSDHAMVRLNSLKGVAFRRTKVEEGEVIGFLLRLLRSKSSQLIDIKVVENGLSDAGFCELAKELESNRMVENLCCEGNKLGLKSAQAIGQVLVLRGSLETLSLKQNKIGDPGMLAICLALLYNRSLRHLDLSYNFISLSLPEQKSAIVEMLGQNDVLTHIDLSGNRLTGDGVALLSEGLKVNDSIKSLILTDNNLFDEDITCLFDLEIRGVRYLDLSYNKIESHSFKTRITPYLLENETLLGLNLSGNRITDLGMAELGPAFKINDTLLDLNLGSNRIYFESSGDEPMLYENLRRNHSLTNLNLSGNGMIADGVLDTIEQLLKRNVNNYNKKKKKTDLKMVLTYGAEGPWNRSKLMVIGQGRAGKTATVRSLLNQPFDDRLDSTIGASLTQIETVHNSKGWEEENMSDKSRSFTAELAARVLARSGEQPSPRSSLSPFKNNEMPFLSPLSNGQFIRESTNKTSQGSTNANGNVKRAGKKKKSKYTPLMDERDVAKVYNEKLILKLVEKETNNDNIKFSIWDYGGQKVFYTLHHLFLTKYGVYLLVFDMQEIINNEESAVGYIRFWLNSVKLHAPQAPILLLGTFFDVIKTFKDAKQLLKRVNKVLSRLLGAKFPQVVKPNTTDQEMVFFPVDNRSRKGFHLIREKIMRCTRDQAYIKRMVSIKWMRILDQISGMKPTVSLETVKQMSKEIGISSDETVEMLKFFNELGVIVYLTSTDALRKTVLTDPQWLIDSLCKVIRDIDIHTYEETELKDAGLSEDIERLFTRGLCSRDVLEHFWEKKKMDFLLDIMRRTLLLSDWKYNQEKVYLIPSMVSTPGTLENRTGEVVRCLFDFAGKFLPLGVFQRLVCLCVAHSATYKNANEPVIFQKIAMVWFGNEPLVIEEVKDTIIVEFQLKGRVSESLSIMNSMMKKISEDISSSGEGLSWSLKLEDSANSEVFVSFSKAKKRKMSPWFSKYEDKKLLNLDLDDFIQGLKLNE